MYYWYLHINIHDFSSVVVNNSSNRNKDIRNKMSSLFLLEDDPSRQSKK